MYIDAIALKLILLAIQERSTLYIHYTNWEGKTSWRHIAPLRVWYGSVMPYHPIDGFLVEAWDIGKVAVRNFAECRIGAIQPIPTPPRSDNAKQSTSTQASQGDGAA